MKATRAVTSLAPQQRGLFDSGTPAIDPALAGLSRLPLDAGAWIDYLPAWLEGHETLLDVLWASTRWEAYQRRMYDRVVEVPRLVAVLPQDGIGHPIIREMSRTLSAHYGRSLERVSLAAYRDGRDSVAFHGDRLGRKSDDAIVAILSLGEPRRFLLRPAAGGASRAFDLGRGDLLVMGGTCQRTWQHGVPKVAHAELRISVQFRSAGEQDE